MERCTQSVRSRVSVPGLRRERIPKYALKEKARVWARNQDPFRLQASGAGTERCQQRAECARSVCLSCAGLWAPEFCPPGFSRSCLTPAPDAPGRRPRPRPKFGSAGPYMLLKDKGPRERERSYTSTHPPSWRETHKDAEKYTETRSQARTRDGHNTPPQKKTQL